jgi:hypothetical protein
VTATRFLELYSRDGWFFFLLSPLPCSLEFWCAILGCRAEGCSLRRAKDDWVCSLSGPSAKLLYQPRVTDLQTPYVSEDNLSCLSHCYSGFASCS